MPQWPEKFGINESHRSFFVIAALTLEKEDIKGGEDAEFFCRRQTGQKISSRKNRFLEKITQQQVSVKVGN